MIESEQNSEAKKTGFLSGLLNRTKSTNSQTKSLKEQYFSLVKILEKLNLKLMTQRFFEKMKRQSNAHKLEREELSKKKQMSEKRNQDREL